MNPPTDMSFNELALQATLTDYGDMGIISIPNIETLSESDRIGIFKEAEQRLIYGSRLDANALLSRLELATPPPGDDEDDLSRACEAQARKDLESDGCPPCLPPHLVYPVRNPPEEYRAIIDYWNTTPGGNEYLCKQRRDWQEFRRWQSRTRARYNSKRFDIYVQEVCECRRRHGLDNNIRLRQDLQQQSKQETWVEFQYYHFKLHEKLQTKYDEQKKKVGDFYKQPGAVKRAISPWLLSALKYAEDGLRLHEVQLQWIEKQQAAMDLLLPTLGETDSTKQVTLSSVQRVSTYQRRPKEQDAHATFSKFRARPDRDSPVGHNRVMHPPSTSLDEINKEPRSSLALELSVSLTSQERCSPYAGSISTRKRKLSAQDGDLDSSALGLPRAKRRMNDTNIDFLQPKPSTGALGHNKKRKKDHDENKVDNPDKLHAPRAFGDYDVQASSQLRRRKPNKRQSIDKEMMIASAFVLTPRITRARRCQVSGKDAQLFQLGQRGEPEIQDHSSGAE